MRTTMGAALLLALAGCSGGAGDEDGGAQPVALVALAPAQQGTVASTVTLYGAVEHGAESQYALSAPVEAIVASIPAPAGTPVGRGELVALLRPTPTTRADLAGAASEARTADAALARAQRLRTDGLASDADVDTARGAAATAHARLSGLSAQAQALALRSPGDGFVETIAANPGDIVAPGATVATISHGGSLRARFGADPGVARRLRPGAALMITSAGGGVSFAASVMAVNPTADPQTRLASVFVGMPARADLGPGQPLTAQVPVAQSGTAITVPYAALLDDGGQPYVFVIRNGVAHRRDVTLGPASGDRVATTAGLSAGDLVVTQGGTAVEDGMQVRTK